MNNQWYYFLRVTPLVILLTMATGSLNGQENKNCTFVGNWAEGPCESAVMHDNILVMHAGCYLRLYDLQNPATPDLISQFECPAPIQSILVEDDLALIGMRRAGLMIVDIGDPANPETLSKLDLLGNRVNLEFYNGDLYYSNDSKGLYIVDITDPRDPSILVNLDSFRGNRLAIEKDIMYVATEYDGFQVYSVADPEQPVLIGHFETPRCEDVDVENNIVYLSLHDSLVIYNASDPAEMERINSIPKTRRRIQLCDVRDGMAYLGTGDRLRIVDVSDPFNPVEIVDYQVESGFVYSMDFKDAFVALSGGIGGTQVLDISSLENPVDIQSIPAIDHSYGIAARDNYALVATGETGLRVFDVTRPEAPVPVDTIALPGRAARVRLIDDFAYVACSYRGLVILDIANPEEVVQVNHLELGGREALDIEFADSLALISMSGSGVAILDISDRANPVQLGEYLLSADRVFDVRVDGKYAYVADFRSGVWILDISDPGSPVEVSRIEDIGLIRSIAIHDNYLYAGLSNPYIRIIDISNPAQPIIVNWYDLYPSRALELFADEQYLYVAAGYNGLFVYDLTDPEKPDIAGYYDTGGDVEDLYTMGEVIYMADYTAGWLVVEFAETTPVEYPENIHPGSISVENIYPNPGSGPITIAYEVYRQQQLKVNVFDIEGRLVQTLTDRIHAPGQYQVMWTGSSISGSPILPGIYLIVFDGDDDRMVRSLSLVR